MMEQECSKQGEALKRTPSSVFITINVFILTFIAFFNLCVLSFQ